MTVGDLFRSDPMRPLEEVQKVNARERAATDVQEFHETESAKRVLTELGDIVGLYPNEGARFLYLHATFGSGKTHLLKLIGFVVDTDAEFTSLGRQLTEQWPGFDTLHGAIDDSHIDRLKPVFLNLLDRDASKEPPLPFLIYEALGRELGYPTDPNWLLDWAWTIDMEYDVWKALDAFEHDGRTFEDVLTERASLRSWLYSALPAMDETTGTDLDTRAGVKASIEAAEDRVNPEKFDSSDLVGRIETATDALNEGTKRTDLLLGLDEVALFVGDSSHRYREFVETMEALQNSLNSVVVATGQYSLAAIHEEFTGDTDANHWTNQQVLLEGADTEIIVRKRWLQKSNAGRERVESLLSVVPDLSLETYSPVESGDPDPLESYPFREYDLALLRKVLQELVTHGRRTDRDYIQGRALLVLVRSLFTTFDWASAEEGAFVTWDELFDLLVMETTYVPLWVQEILENTLVPTFGGEDAWEVRVSKALYLLNQAPEIPATPENLGRLMVDDVGASLEGVIENTRSALETLVAKRKALTEVNDHGDEVYTLVSEEQESILTRAQAKAGDISPHQLSAWLETRLRENDDFFRSDGTRHEVDIGNERLVPLRYEYSVLNPIDRAPSSEFDALRVRMLANEPDILAEQVSAWQEVNDGRDGGEHVLVAISVSETMLDRIRNVIGMGQVLDEETETHEELRREHRADKRRLGESVREALGEASVYTVHERRGVRPNVLDAVIEERVKAVFGATRKTLSRPLVEVDDTKAMTRFFNGSDEWPLSSGDAAMLGVDITTTELTDGWCREFIAKYKEQTALDVETLLQQTRTRNGAYRGTPQESIAALLITLATSNERVALKQDVEYVTDPAEIGRQVRTKGGLTSLQVRFDAPIVDPTQVREVTTAILGDSPDGSDPDEWVAELASWVDEHSALVKRTFKNTSKEFDISLDALDAALEPALSGGELATADLVDDDVLGEAETFADARELFAGDPSLWERFSAVLDTMTELYSEAEETASMQKTAGSNSVPSVTTVESRLEDARAHRVEHLSAQYRRISGEVSSANEPEAICADLTEWVRANEETVRGILDEATAEFEDVVLADIEALFVSVWDGEGVEERDLASVVQQARTYERVRALFADTDGQLWAKLREAGERLHEEHPDSPTTESVETALSASRPPTEVRVHQLLESAEKPKPPDAGDDVWDELQRVAEELRLELPNAAVTDEVTGIVDADERPSEERAGELVSEAETVLARIGAVREELDNLEDGSIVLIERTNRD